MKKLASLLFLFSILCSYTYGQSLMLNKTRFVGSTAHCYANCRFSIATSDGGILFVGETDCFTGGGDIPPSPADSGASSLPVNLLIGKLDSDMNVTWVKVYGGSRTDFGKSAVQTPDGGYAILALTESSNRDVSGHHGFATDDLWLVRIDAAGNLLWQKCYGSSASDQPVALANTPDNGFVLLGVNNGAGDDVPAHHSGSMWDYDWVVFKTDNSGNLQWSKSIGGTGDEGGNGSILAVNGGYFLASSSGSRNYDCIDTAWHAGISSLGDYYVFKLDFSGNVIWGKSYGSMGGEDVRQAIWDNRDNSIVINGLTTSDGYMVSGNHGQWDMWVIKLDTNGNLKWQKCLGGIKDETGTSIAISKNGYVVYGRASAGNIGLTDGWLFALDMDGNMLTDRQIGGSGHEWMSCVSQYKHGFAATGSSNSFNFSQGDNVGHGSGIGAYIFISYVDNWPAAIQPFNEQENSVTVCPNPASNRIQIGIPNDGNVSITDYIGKEMYSNLQMQKKKQIELDISLWPQGVYIIKWRGENGETMSTKFVR
jgi:hypothetical protein